MLKSGAQSIRICIIQWCSSRFLFLTRNNLLGKFGRKNQNFQFVLKFGTYANNLNTQNSMLVLILSVLDLEIPFMSIFGPKNQNCQFKLKFGTQTNSNMQNSVVRFTFSVFGSTRSKKSKPKFIKLVFDTYANLNMRNFLVLFILLFLD